MSSCHRYALSVITCTAGDDTASLFLICELTYLIISASELKASGFLKVFGFKVKITFVIKLGRLYQICFSGNVF